MCYLYNDIHMDAMTTLTLSPKFQVVIPKHIREAMQLIAGMPMQVVQYGDRIEFIPVKPMKAARGLLKGMGTTFDREDDR
jgi:AbrB family looped-hinge helix DNA binding protein